MRGKTGRLSYRLSQLVKELGQERHQPGCVRWAVLVKLTAAALNATTAGSSFSSAEEKRLVMSIDKQQALIALKKFFFLKAHV